ncbi:MAG: hypothetical protein R2726_12465 [Acidimicrobiales bacterium]
MNTMPASINDRPSAVERRMSAWQLIWFAGDDSWAVERGVEWDATDQSWRHLERLASGAYEDCWRAMVSELGRHPILIDAEPEMWCAFPHRAWQVS